MTSQTLLRWCLARHPGLSLVKPKAVRALNIPSSVPMGGQATEQGLRVAASSASHGRWCEIFQV